MKKPAKASKIRSLSQFIETVTGLREPSPVTYAFRGVRDAGWENAPGIMRDGKEQLLMHERQAIRDLLSIHPHEFVSDLSMFDKLVRMQHFGLPTRLLDVTLNPLAALYFATEVVDPKIEEPSDGKVYVFTVPPERRKYFDSDAVSCTGNLANLADTEKRKILENISLRKDQFNTVDAVDRLLQFIRVEKPYFRSMINATDMLTVQFVIPKLNNRRIIAQNGAFLIFGLSVKKRLLGTSPIRTQEVVVDRDDKQQIRLDLDKLGVNESALFPEIDRAAIYVARKFST